MKAHGSSFSMSLACAIGGLGTGEPDSGPGRESRLQGNASWGLQSWSAILGLFWSYRASTVPWCRWCMLLTYRTVHPSR